MCTSEESESGISQAKCHFQEHHFRIQSVLAAAHRCLWQWNVFSKIVFFMRICLFWKWPWTLSQSWYLSHCEQILVLGTSCSEAFVIWSVSLCCWKNMSNLGCTYVVIFYSFKPYTFNNSLGTHEYHYMKEQISDTTDIWILNIIPAPGKAWARSWELQKKIQVELQCNFTFHWGHLIFRKVAYSLGTL